MKIEKIGLESNLDDSPADVRLVARANLLFSAAIPLIACIAAIMVISSNRTFPVSSSIHQQLPAGETNAALSEIGSSGYLPLKSKVYLGRDYTSAGILVDFEDSHRFDDSTRASAILFRWNDGQQMWVKRDLVKKCWIDAFKDDAAAE